MVKCLEDNFATMARPVLDTTPAGEELHRRFQVRLDWLGALGMDRLTDPQIDELTAGRRGAGDSLHLLVMDLHKQINKLSSVQANEVMDGANDWDLQPQDRARVLGFMRGLNRKSMLKFDYPGLETAATRDGERLLIQNDIGTYDAHVLVIQAANQSITLTISDLHHGRHEFFQTLRAPFGDQVVGPGFTHARSPVTSRACLSCRYVATPKRAISLRSNRPADCSRNAAHGHHMRRGWSGNWARFASWAAAST
jgi:hypothetical protein